MKVELLESILCPKCKSGVRKKIYKKKEDSVNHATLKCSCSLYPVLDGVIILKSGSLYKTVCSLISSKRFNEARSLLVSRPRMLFLYRKKITNLLKRVNNSQTVLEKYLRLLSLIETTLFEKKSNSFVESVKSMSLGNFGEYLMNRSFCYSYWNLHAVLESIYKNDGPVLDYGGGWGHSTCLIQRVTNETTVNLEIDFLPLYHQKKFLSSNTIGIVIEPSSDIPFEKNTFKSTIDLDGFHYVTNKNGIAGEYERVTHPKGCIYLLHTHNKNVSSRGYPLSYSSYNTCFSWSSTFVPEKFFLTKYIKDENIIDLRRYSKKDIHYQDLNIFLRKNNSPKKIDTSPGINRLHRQDLKPVPVYDMYKSRGKINLKRGDISTYLSEEFDFSVNNSAEKYSLSSLDKAQTELLKKGILVPQSQVT